MNQRPLLLDNARFLIEKQEEINKLKREAEEKEEKRITEIKSIEKKAEEIRLEEIRLREAKEKKDREDKAEEDRKEKERIADKEHRKKINNNILTALAAAGITSKDGKVLITEIVAGHIPNVTINY